MHVKNDQPLYSLTVGEYIELMKAIQSGILPKNATVEQIKDLLNIQETAAYLQMSVATLYTFNSRKKIPFIRVTGKVYYRRSALDAWLASGERKTNAQLRREAMEGGVK